MHTARAAAHQSAACNLNHVEVGVLAVQLEHVVMQQQCLIKERLAHTRVHQQWDLKHFKNLCMHIILMPCQQVEHGSMVTDR